MNKQYLVSQLPQKTQPDLIQILLNFKYNSSFTKFETQVTRYSYD